MPKNDSKYNSDWENEYDFISEGSTVYHARCNKCKNNISIRSAGKGDIKKHCNSVVSLSKHTL